MLNLSGLTDLNFILFKSPAVNEELYRVMVRAHRAAFSWDKIFCRK